MKFNLKNFPKPHIYEGSRKISTGSTYKHRMYVLTEVDQWFEEFKKQEREKQTITLEGVIDRFSNRIWTSASDAVTFYRAYREGYIQRGKEILGDK